MTRHRACVPVTRRLWLAVGFLPASIVFAWAQAPDGRIPTVSRLVVLFTQQELQLAERIKARDASGVGALLTDDFELRASSQPGQPVPRADWIDQSLKSPTPTGAPRDMAVHDLGNAALVSFQQPFGSAKSSMFVVDLWRRSGNDWKLAVRYAAPAGSDGASMPGVPRATPQIPKKY